MAVLQRGSKEFSEASAFFRDTNVRLGLASSTRPIGSPPVDAPFSKPKPNDNNPREFTNNNIPIGLPRETCSFLAAVEITKRVNAGSINATDASGWKLIKVGIDSCAAESVSPPGCFPGEVQVTQRVGEEYTCASDHVIYNQGQQTPSGVTNDWLPVSYTSQVTDVNKPLMSVKRMKDNDNTVVFSKKWGDFIINDITGVATQMVDENNTFHLPIWVPFPRPE